MDTNKLRQKILDLAIRGKLVPQDPNDEPASVLLERIRAEKERLIKEGKIKRSKKVADDDEIEAPFEIPESWECVRLDDLLINRDSERVPLSLAIRKKQTNKIYDYYGAAGVIDKVDGYLFSERLLLIGEDGANLLSRSKNNAFFAEGKYWVNNHAHVLDCSEKYILDFVAFVINSMSLEKYVTGSAQPKLTQDNLNKIIISLPPKEEQRRIINEVKRWFTLIDELESNEGDLLKAIDKAKSKILDLAIHGKLVPQDPNDEPAIEILKRINPKFEPCDNKQIPNSWEVVSFQTICESISSKPYQILQSEIKDSGKTPVISQSANYIEGYSDKEDCIFKNDNAILIFGDHTRVLKYVDFDFIVGADGVKIIKTIFPTKYLYYVLLHTIHNMQGKGYARHYSILSKTQIPVPPKEEELRIVAKIEELFAVLDGIKESLQ